MRFAAADTMRQTPDEYAPYLTEDLGAYTERASPLAPLLRQPALRRPRGPPATIQSESRLNVSRDGANARVGRAA